MSPRAKESGGNKYCGSFFHITMTVSEEKTQRRLSIEERYALIESKVPKYLKEFAFRGAIDIQVKSLELLMHSTNLYSVIRQADEDRRALHGRWTEWRPEIKSDVIRISKRIVINVWNMMEGLTLEAEDQAVQIH